MLDILFDAEDPSCAARVGCVGAECRTLVTSGRVEVFQTLTLAEANVGAPVAPAGPGR